MFIPRISLSYLIAYVALFADVAAAQSKRPPDLPLSRAEVRAILTNAAQLVEQRYVDPDGGRRIAAALRNSLNDTSIISTTSSLGLVPKVNRILTAAQKDAHLAFGYSFESKTEKDDTLLTAAELESLRLSSEKSGHGVRKVERLAGNVGYMQMTAFRDPAFAAEAIAASMSLMRGTGALIIDLRDSEGGAPEMVAFLASYFFKEPTLLNEAYLRPADLHKQAWTTQWVPGEKYLRPLYILTNKVTRSAAEGFTYALQARRRATVVGAVSRGAAHMGRWENVSSHFAIYIPMGKVTDAVTKSDWEQTGVKPDVLTTADEALTTAHMLALEKLLTGATDKDDRETLSEALSQLKASASGGNK